MYIMIEYLSTKQCICANIFQRVVDMINHETTIGERDFFLGMTCWGRQYSKTIYYCPAPWFVCYALVKQNQYSCIFSYK